MPHRFLRPPRALIIGDVLCCEALWASGRELAFKQFSAHFSLARTLSAPLWSDALSYSAIWGRAQSRRDEESDTPVESATQNTGY